LSEPQRSRKVPACEHKREAMDTLSPAECQVLIEVLTEQLGRSATNEQFCDSLLGLLEDIPRLEHLTPAKAARLAQQLWRNYLDQEKRQD